jgi:hypothetical protein
MAVLLASLVFASARLRLVAGASVLLASLVFASARLRLVAGASLGGFELHGKTA